MIRRSEIANMRSHARTLAYLIGLLMALLASERRAHADEALDQEIRSFHGGDSM